MSDFNSKLFEKDPNEQDLEYEIELSIELKRSEDFLKKWLLKELKIQNSDEIMEQIYDVSDKLPINYNPGGLE